MKFIDKPNYTQIPNVIIDEWVRDVSPAAGIILLIICRQTFGWHKQSDKISQSQFVEKSGMGKNAVIRALAELVKAGMISASPQYAGAKRLTTVYSIRVTTLKNNVPETDPLNCPYVPETGTPYVPKIDPTKETFKEKEFKQTQRPVAARADALVIVEQYNKVFQKNIKLTPPRLAKINSTLKDHSLEDIINSIEGMAQDDWTKKSGRNEIERLIDPGKRDRNIELWKKKSAKSNLPKLSKYTQIIDGKVYDGLGNKVIYMGRHMTEKDINNA